MIFICYFRCVLRLASRCESCRRCESYIADLRMPTASTFAIVTRMNTTTHRMQAAHIRMSLTSGMRCMCTMRGVCQSDCCRCSC